MDEKTDSFAAKRFPNGNVSFEEKAKVVTPTDSDSTISPVGKDVEPNVQRVDSVSGSSLRDSKHEWRGTLLRIGPLSGIFAFGGVILCTIASLGILAGSNHSPVTSWPTPPSTFIAIFTAISNIMMRYAAVQGIVVAWWIKALHGSSVSELHYNWRAGASFHGALMAGRHMGWIGVASILSCIVIVIDGPLLQRSSTVTTASHTGPTIDLHFTMVPEMPTDYTGGWLPGNREVRWSTAFNSTIPSPGGTIPNTIYAGGQNILAEILPAWATNKPLANSVSGCADKCTARLIAPALTATSCVTKKQPVDYTTPYDLNSALGTLDAPPLSHESFIIATAIDVSGERETINALTAYAPSQDCIGYIELTVCSLESAVGEYNITIENNEITIENAASPRIIGIANNTAVNHNAQPNGYRLSTLSGVVQAAHLVWDSSIAASRANGSTDMSGAGSHSYYLFQGAQDQGKCGAFRDPREEYMASLNKNMVYLGSYAARGIANPRLDTLDPGLQVNQTTTGQITGARSVYSTHYMFFLGAALVEVICICLIAPTYWGWWKIGRAVSFSPLEIARAFGAPVLDHVNSNSTGVEIARSCNDQRIRYGSMSAVSRSNKLAFSRPDAVSWPRRGSVIEV